METKNINCALAIFGQILQQLVIVEGMKATNKEREANGMALAYDEKAFMCVADEIGNQVRYLHNL